MRVIKLSPRMDFNNEDDVIRLLEEDLPSRYRGRFRMTAGRMRPGSPGIGEVLLFSNLGQVYYIARAASERLGNDDQYSDELPHCFEIDLGSIHRVNISLHEVKQRHHAATGHFKQLAHSQGWPEIEDQAFEDTLWRELVG